MVMHTVKLTDEQIELLLESLKYSAKAFRDYNYDPAEQEWAAAHRNERLELISETRTALRAAK